jgi:FkbM family methyltransferase
MRLTIAASAARPRLGARRLAKATRVEPAGTQILRAFADVYPKAVFIEIGANDGVQHDHLRPFITAFPWRGVMVEPLPWVFAHLRNNYRGRKGVILENAAIADVDGVVPFYYAVSAEGRAPDDPPIWSDTIGSLSRLHVEEDLARGRAFAAGTGILPGTDSRIERTEVPSLTFESLCRKHRIQELDLLLIDAQGYDYEIIKGIDFNRHRPRLLIYESSGFSAAERAQSKAYIRRLGYETMDEGLDTWCHDPRADDSLARCWRGVRRRLRVRSLLHRIGARLATRQTTRSRTKAGSG